MSNPSVRLCFFAIVIFAEFLRDFPLEAIMTSIQNRVNSQQVKSDSNPDSSTKSSTKITGGYGIRLPGFGVTDA